MDLLSFLHNLLNPQTAAKTLQPQQPQQQPAVNPYQLPNANQVPLNGLIHPYGNFSPVTVGNVDKPASLPRYSGLLPTLLARLPNQPEANLNVYVDPKTGQRTWEDDNNPNSPVHNLTQAPVLPDQPTPTSLPKGLVNANPTYSSNLYQSLLSSARGRA